MLPEYAINRILQKFGPEIVNYLKSVGFFDIEGEYNYSDYVRIINGEFYLTPSKYKNRYINESSAKNREVWAAVEKYMLPEMELCSEEFAKAYNLKPVWNVADIAKAYFQPHSGELIKNMTHTDQSKLARYIWANAGKNERPLARQILKEPGLSSIVDLTGSRARTIIRTERHRAAWGSSLEFAKSAGSETKEWVTAGDNRVRSSHRALNGVVVGIDEEFPGGRQYPGDIDINCRCHLNYGFDKSVRRTGVHAGTKTPPPYTGLSDEALDRLYGNATPGQNKKATTSGKAIAFMPAKSLKEAEEWAKNNIAKDVIYPKGVSLEVANAVNEHILKRLSDWSKHFPDGKIDGIEFKPTGKAALQNIVGTTRLNVNAKYKKLEKIREQVDEGKFYQKHTGKMWNSSGYFDRDRGLGVLIDHEMGHMIHLSQMRDKTQLINPIYESKKTGWKGPTEYSQRNDMELFAESFACYVNGKTDVLAEPIIKFLDELMK